MHTAQLIAAKLSLAAVLCVLFTPADASAQQSVLDSRPAAEDSTEWNYQHTPTPLQIIQQKAQARAAQRAARIESQAWYGFSKSRPTSTATPFSGLYGSQWQGYTYGRPAAWHASRPVIVITK